MKNFRKVLALILVVATLFSFVAMASAKTAEEYADYSEVKNVVAVDIMTALGINEGYDGKFHPADTIDRDEVAAMIARLRNGGKFDAALYVGAPNVFADVKGQWSEGYVTYCTQLGIINGLNETTFNPDGKITVVDTLKLLLCVLGYDAKLSGYVGPNYKVAVVRDADKMGLTDGIASTDMFKEATRDQVALMFFNALKARLVYGYVSENIVTITNSLLGSKFYEGITSVTLPALTNAEVAYCNAVISNETLGNVLGVYKRAGYDCFGRPGDVWFAPGWFKFYPAAAASVKADGTCPVAENAVIEALYVNGEKIENADIRTVKSYLGKGVQAEAYAVGGAFRVVIVETFFAKVTYINARTGKATIMVDGSDDQLLVDAGALKAGDVVMFHVCDLMYTYVEDGLVKDLKKCNAGIVNDLVCIDHDCADNIHDITVVTPVEVKVDETHRVVANIRDSYILTPDETKYEYSKNLNHELVVTDSDADDLGIMTWNAKGDTKLLYLDDHGYIQYWCAPAAAGAAAPEVAYFVEGSNKWSAECANGDVALGTHKYTCWADIVKMDASQVDDMVITEATFNKMIARGQDQQGTWKDGILARYTADGNIVEEAKIASQASWLNAHTGELENQVAPSGFNYHFDANTRFLVRTWDIATGAPAYEAVTGYKAMPEYLGKLVFGDQKYYNSIQFLTAGENSDYITDLFIDAFYVKTTADFVYIVEKVEDIGVAGLGQYFTEFAYYKAYIKGEVAYVAYFNVEADDNNQAWTAANLKENTLYKTAVKAVNGTYKGAPIYVAMTDADANIWAAATQYDDIVVNNGQIELWKDGSKLEIKQANYLDDLTVYVISGASDVAFGAYTGTEFVKKYQTPDYTVMNDVNVYTLGDPISTLVLKIG